MIGHADDHDPEPDPDEPITRWEVTGCKRCARLLVRPLRRAGRGADGWRHVSDNAGGQP